MIKKKKKIQYFIKIEYKINNEMQVFEKLLAKIEKQVFIL